MDSKTATTVGRYIDFAVFDRSDFESKMRAGYSFDQYMIDEKNHGFRIAVGPNQSAKNKFQVYVYHVGGREYYKVNPIPVSWDIRDARKGNPIGVRYNPDDPYDAVIDKNVNVAGSVVAPMYNDSAKKSAKEVPILIAFLLSLFSLGVGFIGFGWFLSVPAIIILLCCKETSSLRKPTLIISIIGIAESILMGVLLILLIMSNYF